MKKTGEFLKKAREDKGLSIHEIGLSLKINPKILKQIEEGDKGNLPAKTFLRGFVQSYALFLKIDPNEVLKIFTDEMGTTRPHQIILTSGPQIKGTSIDIDDPQNKVDTGIKRNTGQNFNKEKFEFKNVGIGIVVFILLLSLIAVRKVVEKYQKEAEVDLVKTEENLKSNNKLELPQAPPAATPIATPAPTPAVDSVKPSVTTDTTTVPDIKPMPISAQTIPPAPPSVPSSESPKPTNKTPPTTPNAITTNPTNPAGPTTALSAHAPGLPTTKPTTTPPGGNTVITPPVVKPTVVEAAKPVAPVPALAAKPGALTTAEVATPQTLISVPKEEPKKPKNIELVIEAYESVEIELTQSSGKTEKIKMSPSQVQTFKTVSGAKLNISNGGAVNIIVNGKDIGVPGDLGKPKRVSF